MSGVTIILFFFFYSLAVVVIDSRAAMSASVSCGRPAEILMKVRSRGFVKYRIKIPRFRSVATSCSAVCGAIGSTSTRRKFESER